jgi:hypothetical protein
MKKNKRIVADSIQSATKTKQNIKVEGLSFLSFIFKDKANKKYLYAGLIIGLVYLIILKILFPSPSYYSDSYTYIQVARDNQDISFRPVEYSEFIRFFKGVTTSDFALIIGQYFFNIVANLFLFFTVTYFFAINKKLKAVLFVLLICNPLYLFYSNYILSDALFCSLTVAWFATLIWTINRFNWGVVAMQLLMLLLLFKLRYNAIVFPVFITIALFLTKEPLWKKITASALGFVLILLLMKNITDRTEELTGTRVFSAFSGWQLANNAMHVLKYENIDTTKLDDDGRNINRFIKAYFDSLPTAQKNNNDVKASYMWDNKSPLKKYLSQYGVKNGFTIYFQGWTAIGPVYNDFGTSVILQKPGAYLKHFVLPNTKKYFFPELEAYDSYNQGADTMAKVAKDYYEYETNKVKVSAAGLHKAVMLPWKYLFPFINFLFLATVLVYLSTGTFKRVKKLFNQSLLLYLLVYFGNLLFVSALAPNVFRYHVFIVTLCVVFIVYLLQMIATNFQKKNMQANKL